VEAVAPGSEIAIQSFLNTALTKMNARTFPLEIVRADVLGFKNDLATRIETSLDQVFHDFLLSVNRNAPSSGQFMKVDAVPLAVEEEFDAVVDQTFPLHSLTHAGSQEKIDGTLLQNTRPDSLLRVFPAPGLDDDRFDTAQME
jgi:hypothetical protein